MPGEHPGLIGRRAITEYGRRKFRVVLLDRAVVVNRDGRGDLRRLRTASSSVSPSWHTTAASQMTWRIRAAASCATRGTMTPPML